MPERTEISDDDEADFGCFKPSDTFRSAIKPIPGDEIKGYSVRRTGLIVPIGELVTWFDKLEEFRQNPL